MEQLKSWVITGISVVAFIVLLKLGMSYLPDGGIPGAFKRVIGTI
jgi:hypothetical protein